MQILLWILVLLGLFVVGSICWARRLNRELREYHRLYTGAVYEVHPMPLPKIVSSRKIRQIEETIEEQGFHFLGYITNSTRLDSDIPHVALVFSSIDGGIVTSITCMTEPRRVLHLRLPYPKLTGRSSVILSMETAFNADFWLGTTALDMDEAHRQLLPNFDLYWLSSETDFKGLLGYHQAKLDACERKDIRLIQNLDDFIESCTRMHKLLAVHSAREFEEIMSESNELWPVDVDIDHH